MGEFGQISFNFPGPFFYLIQISIMGFKLRGPFDSSRNIFLNINFFTSELLNRTSWSKVPGIWASA